VRPLLLVLEVLLLLLDDEPPELLFLPVPLPPLDLLLEFELRLEPPLELLRDDEPPPEPRLEELLLEPPLLPLCLPCAVTEDLSAPTPSNNAMAAGTVIR